MAIRNEQLLIRLTEEVKRKIVNSALERDITMSALVSEALEFYLGFDPYFLERLKNSSRNFGIQESILLQNIGLKWMANGEAELEVKGKTPTLFKEFPFTNSGILTGEPLFNMLKSMFKHQYLMENRNNQIRLDSHLPSSPPDGSKKPTFLTHEENEIIEKYLKGTDLNEEEKTFAERYLKEQEEEAEAFLKSYEESAKK